MVGDQQDMLLRMKRVLPLRWFPDDTPILDTLLSGLALAWASVYGLLQVVKLQARIATAQGMWLDLVALDYFGSQVCRHAGESDGSYRLRIQRELIRERGTRQAVIAAITDLTARQPHLFEPANASDTGGYGAMDQAATGLAYGCAGGWGDLALPFQFFVTAYRPIGTGIAYLSGWNSSGGGYCNGALQYSSLSMMQTQVTDNDICEVITQVLPIGVVAWTRITN